MKGVLQETFYVRKLVVKRSSIPAFFLLSGSSSLIFGSSTSSSESNLSKLINFPQLRATPGTRKGSGIVKAFYMHDLNHMNVGHL